MDQIRITIGSNKDYNRIQRHKPRSDFTQVAIFEKSFFFIHLFSKASYDLPVAEKNGPGGPASKKDRFVQQTVKIQEMAVELQNPFHNLHFYSTGRKVGYACHAIPRKADVYFSQHHLPYMHYNMI